MPRPSYAALKKMCSDLMQENAKLRTYAPFNVTTRAGLPFEFARCEHLARHIVFLDMDDMHGANKKYGYETVNGKIKRALHVRHTDVLIRSLWYSGDEFVIVLNGEGDPAGFMTRLRTALKNEGMSATMVAVPYTGNLENDIRIAMAIVQAKKEGYPR